MVSAILSMPCLTFFSLSFAIPKQEVNDFNTIRTIKAIMVTQTIVLPSRLPSFMFYPFDPFTGFLKNQGLFLCQFAYLFPVGKFYP